MMMMMMMMNVKAATPYYIIHVTIIITEIFGILLLVHVVSMTDS